MMALQCVAGAYTLEGQSLKKMMRYHAPLWAYRSFCISRSVSDPPSFLFSYPPSCSEHDIQERLQASASGSTASVAVIT